MLAATAAKKSIPLILIFPAPRKKYLVVSQLHNRDRLKAYKEELQYTRENATKSIHGARDQVGAFQGATRDF